MTIASPAGTGKVRDQTRRQTGTRFQTWLHKCTDRRQRTMTRQRSPQRPDDRYRPLRSPRFYTEGDEDGMRYPISQIRVTGPVYSSPWVQPLYAFLLPTLRRGIYKSQLRCAVIGISISKSLSARHPFALSVNISSWRSEGRYYLKNTSLPSESSVHWKRLTCKVT